MTLVELLIALSLGVILLSVGLQVYLSVKKNYGLQQDLIERQQKLMFLSYFIIEKLLHEKKGCLLDELYLKNKTLYWRKFGAKRSLALVSGLKTFRVWKDGRRGLQVTFGIKKPWIVYVVRKGLC